MHSQIDISEPSVTSEGMRALEASAMRSGWSQSALMTEAGRRLGHAIACYFPTPGTAVAWLGKGNNAGDALVALRVLHDAHGWKIRIRDCYGHDDLTPIARGHRLDQSSTPAFDLDDPEITFPLLVLDGLLGIGADGSPLRGPLDAASAEINILRRHSGAVVVAVDVPSGIHPDTGDFPANAVKADVTFTLGAVKSGLMLPQSSNAVGSLRFVPVPPLVQRTSVGVQAKARQRLVCPQLLGLPDLLRPYDAHKGMAGRVSILAGSLNYMGAAALCSKAAVAAGAGLVTLHVPKSLHMLAASKCAPEVIVKPYQQLDQLLSERADSWIIGCGIGNDHGGEVLALIDSLADRPMLLDADALNIIARNQALHVLRKNHLITPHPGEFTRLVPDLAGMLPLAAVERWTRLSAAALLLKGCRSVIGSGDEEILVNSTGNPGMATAGMGDVLAGVGGSLLAIGFSTRDSGAFAAWLCGRAAERAISHASESHESLRASHVIRHLGGAFSDWKYQCR